MSAVKCNYAWIAICLASICLFQICLKSEATPVATVVKSLSTAESSSAFKSFNIDDVQEIEPISRKIVARSADADDNSVDEDENEDKDDKTEKPHSDKSEEIFPENKNHHQSHHAHGSHGGLAPVQRLLKTVQDRFHGNGGGGGLIGILGPHHPASEHESPIETEEDRTMINSSTGLHVLEVLGTLFGLLWGFLSNIPALFGSSSSGLSGGQ